MIRERSLSVEMTVVQTTEPDRFVQGLQLTWAAFFPPKLLIGQESRDWSAAAVFWSLVCTPIRSKHYKQHTCPDFWAGT